MVLTYKDAAGMWWADKWRPLVGCIVNLILNIILVKTIGVGGVMLSTIISYLFVELPWETHVLFKIYFQQSEKQYYLEMFIVTFRIFVAGVVTWYVCSLIEVGNIVAIVVKLAVCIVLPNVIFILLNMGNKDFKTSMAFIKNVFHEIL